MRLRALDYVTARRIELHGDEWDVVWGDIGRGPLMRGVWEIAMRSHKTGHIKWWPWFHVEDQMKLDHEYLLF